MVSGDELRDGEGEVVGGQQTMKDLMVKIDFLCLQHGLSYHHHPPIQVSPGIYMFYAVKMDDNCRNHGSCRQQQYYAIDIGSSLKLC